MKETIYVVAILLQIGVIVFFVRRNRMLKKNLAKPATDPAEGSFEHKRALALGVTTQHLQLMIPDNITFVYGVVMDWNTGDAMICLATYITGAANLYSSMGIGVSGAGKDPMVGEAAVKFVTTAADHIERVVPVASTDVALHPDCVRFYLLTNRGILAGQERVKYFDDGTSPWLEVFKLGNMVIHIMSNHN